MGWGKCPKNFFFVSEIRWTNDLSGKQVRVTHKNRGFWSIAAYIICTKILFWWENFVFEREIFPLLYKVGKKREVLYFSSLQVCPWIKSSSQLLHKSILVWALKSHCYKFNLKSGHDMDLIFAIWYEYAIR